MSRKKSGLVGGIITGVIIFIGVICLIMCIEKIPVGYEAVVYSINGGVQDETLTQGWHIISPTKKQRYLLLVMNSCFLHRIAGKAVKRMIHLKYQLLMMQA